MSIRLGWLLAGPLLLGGAVGAANAAVTEDQFQLRDTSDFVALCTASAGDQLMTAAANFCQGFAVGVYRTLQDEQTAMPRRLFCPPQTTPPSRNEAIAHFVQWVQTRPSLMQGRAEDSILAYLQYRFPCTTRR
jgi:hypothetical protein